MTSNFGLRSLTAVLIATAVCGGGCSEGSVGRTGGPTPALSLKPTIAVARLEVQAELPAELVQSLETGSMHHQMVSALVEAGSVHVVEGEAMHDLLGTLSEASVRSQRTRLPYTDYEEERSRIRLRVDFRLVDRRSGAIVAAGSEEVAGQHRHLLRPGVRNDADPLVATLERELATKIAERTIQSLNGGSTKGGVS